MTAFAQLTDPVFEAIKTYLGDGIAVGAWQSAPIRYPNEPWTMPVESPWIDFEFAANSFSQQSIGEADQADNRWDEEGQIYMHVMVPVGSGSSPVRGAAKELATLFRGKTLIGNQLEFLDASLGLGEEGTDQGNWFRVTVRIDWRYWNA